MSLLRRECPDASPPLNCRLYGADDTSPEDSADESGSNGGGDTSLRGGSSRDADDYEDADPMSDDWGDDGSDPGGSQPASGSDYSDPEDAGHPECAQHHLIITA